MARSVRTIVAPVRRSSSQNDDEVLWQPSLLDGCGEPHVDRSFAGLVHHDLDASAWGGLNLYRDGRDSVAWHGDLLVTGGTCRHTWQHSAPKTATAGPRISVTFRTTPVL